MSSTQLSAIACLCRMERLAELLCLLYNLWWKSNDTTLYISCYYCSTVTQGHVIHSAFNLYLLMVDGAPGQVTLPALEPVVEEKRHNLVYFLLLL